MKDEDYVKKLEERLEFYETFIRDNHYTHENWLAGIPNGDLRFLKLVCGIQPHDTPAALAFAIRETNSGVNLESIGFRRANDHDIKDHVLGLILRQCETTNFLYESDVGVYEEFNKARLNIYTKSLRGEGKVIWCSKGILERIKANDLFHDNTNTGWHAGTFAHMCVYCDESLPFEAAIVAYQGFVGVHSDAGLLIHPYQDTHTVTMIDGWENYYHVIRIS